MAIVHAVDEVVSVPYDPKKHRGFVLTNWYYPDEREASGWAGGAAVNHNDWMKLEIASFAEAGRNVFAVKNSKGKMALVEITKGK